MSTQDKKVGHYSLYFVDLEEFRQRGIDEEYEHIVDTALLKNLIQYIMSLGQLDKTRNIKSSNKFYFLDEHLIDEDIVDYLSYLKFISAKYAHRPDLVSQHGSRRTNPKTMDEGEGEKTHLSIMECEDEYYVVLEQRQNSISMSKILEYLNRFLRDYHKSINIKQKVRLFYDIIPSESFIEGLGRLNRISFGSIFIEKNKLGSEFQVFSGKNSDTIREELELVFKAEPRQTIKKPLVKSIHKKYQENKFKRIRIIGSTEDNNRLVLDTLNAKLTDFIKVELDSDGTVNSQSAYTALKEVLLERIE